MTRIFRLPMMRDMGASVEDWESGHEFCYWEATVAALTVHSSCTWYAPLEALAAWRIDRKPSI